MQGLKVNKSAVKGNNFDTDIVYLVSVIRVISWLLSSLLLSITTLLSLLLYYCLHALIIMHMDNVVSCLYNRSSGHAAPHQEKSKKTD